MIISKPPLVANHLLGCFKECYACATHSSRNDEFMQQDLP